MVKMRRDLSLVSRVGCLLCCFILKLNLVHSALEARTLNTSDFTGNLSLVQFNSVSLVSSDSWYDLASVPSLYDSVESTGVSNYDTSFYYYFYIKLNQPHHLRYVYVTYSVESDSDPANAGTKIEWSDLDDNGAIKEVSVFDNEMEAFAPAPGQSPGTYFGYVRWEYGATDNTDIFTDNFAIKVRLTDDLPGQLVTGLEIDAIRPTIQPTEIPTSEPTTGSPTAPSISPSAIPSDLPTTSPTEPPTPPPTYAAYTIKTETSAENPNNTITFKESANVYDLSLRNETYTSFTVPGNKAYCTTCILAWAEIDARIWVDGCEDYYDFGIQYSDGNVIEPGAFYYCNGTWTIQTSASLVSWQQTYGRLEIWEVDDLNRKYQQVYYEFQWNTSVCTWYDEELGKEVNCSVLPLTGDPVDAAMFQFTMPKNPTDNRHNPLIVVWYDLLSVPYSLRPAINDTWWNLTFNDIPEGDDLGFEEVVSRFQIAIYAAGLLLLGFVCVMFVACIAADEAILKADYMLDTRDIRTTYIHSVTTLIAPQSELQSRAKFSIKRHGIWLFLVIGFRLVYMFVFTFIFFAFVFETINDEHYKTLDFYDSFAHERDSQLTNMSAAIESYYYNETDRLEIEVEWRNKWCYAVYVNETARLYEVGAIDQYNNHTKQMENSLNSIDFNVTTGMYIEGKTACDIDTSSGAVVGSRDPYTKVNYNSDGTFNSTVAYYASDYNRSRTTGFRNFTFLEDLLTTVCETTSGCIGWTWIDAYYDNLTNTSYDNSYYLLETMGDPINSDLDGLCYATSDFDASEYSFGSISDLANYTNYLESLYLSNYEEDVDSMYDTLTSVWDSIKEMSASNENHIYRTVINSDATDFNMDVELEDIDLDYNQTTKDFEVFTWWVVVVNCPGCPSGNFSNAYLEQLADYLFTYNYTNISDFVNTVGGNDVNFSEVVSVNTALLEYPDVPEIDLPFDIDIPNMGFWDLIRSITITLDVILFVYRWYRTAGIIASIVRGKDVEIRMKYLKTELAEPRPFWVVGRQVADNLLNACIWCHDQIRHCGYNVWKFMYWIWVIMQLCILVLCILMLYIMVDGVVTVKFFTSLGAFDLLTVGIAAQRSIRNEVICTTALSYNNYTLALLMDSRETYAELKNEQAWEQNIDELDRVDEYNSYFCTAYTAYQATDRDVTRDCGCNIDATVDITTELSIDNMADGNDDTYWGVTASDGLSSNTDAYVDLELPAIAMTRSEICWWTISQIQFDWRYSAVGSQAGVLSSVEFEVYAKLNENDTWAQQDLDASLYSVPSKNTTSELEENNVEWDLIVRYVRIVFKDVDQWEDTLFLNEISFTGAADPDCIACQQVQFYYWDFDASSTYIELCPSVTPVHGIMYRGWVRDWLTDQLIEGHKPFIRAFRNICLSPFTILLVGAIVLLLVYLLAFVVEWILIKVNLYRENPYAKVALVHAKNSEFYDPSKHDVDDAETHADKTTYFGNSGTLVQDEENGGGGTGDGTGATGDGHIPRASEIEKHMDVELHTLRQKKQPSYAANTGSSVPIAEDNEAAAPTGDAAYLASIGVNAAQPNYYQQQQSQDIVADGSVSGNQAPSGYKHAELGNYVGVREQSGGDIAPGAGGGGRGLPGRPPAPPKPPAKTNSYQ